MASAGAKPERHRHREPPTPPPPPPMPTESSDVDTRSPDRRICLVGELAKNEELLLAASSFGIPVIVSDTGQDILDEDVPTVTHFVLQEFEGSMFETLRKSHHRVLGPTAVLQLWKQQEKQLPDNIRPLYSISMRSTFICFTGFRIKEELTHLINLIHHMGGSIRKDMSARVTHLIANCSGGEKYRYATSFNVPVIGQDWVERFWLDRHVIERRATDEALLKEYKLKAFLGCKVCFVGFPEEECQHMSDVLVENGGEVANLEDASCSHVVVANGGYYDSLCPSPSVLCSPLTELSMSYLNSDKKSNNLIKKRFNMIKCSETVSRPSKIRCIDLNTDNEVKRNSNSVFCVDDLTNLSDSSYLRKLFYPEEDEESETLILPSMSSVDDVSNTAVSKKRQRSSIESNFEVENLPKECHEVNNWKSPFKKLKLKDSFRFKSKERPVINRIPSFNKSKFRKDKNNKEKKDNLNLSNCTLSTMSPEKDDHDTSICSISSVAKADRSFFSSSGIFDVSFSSLRQSKTMKSMSKIRRSMKSITSSFRGERKKSYDKHRTDNDFMEDYIDSQLDAAITEGQNARKDSLSLNVTSNIIERDEVDEVSGKHDIRISPIIFKTPKKTPNRRHRHNTCEMIPSSSSPIPTKSKSNLRNGAVGIACEPFNVVHPMICLPEARFNTNTKNSLDCSVLSVVDEHNTQTLPDVGPSAQIVRAEWFWISVQNEEAQDERDYLFEDYLEAQKSPSRRSSRGSLSSGASGGGTSPPQSPAASGRTPSSVTNSQRLRKRKLRGPEGALHKRRSSVGDAVLLSISGNLLDCTASPDGKQSVLDEVESVNVSDAARKHMSPRQQVFMELVQTEFNYVGILHTIVTIFKQPLEEMTNDDDPSKALLNNTELKIIFGNLMPIYEIHRKMLEELRQTSHNWSEELSIGRIVLKYAPDLVKAYPPFVNFFENMKEMLAQCDKEKPRFHAFLKGRQTKPECGRQTLQELLIRPVQRLPSISLLLDDILKHTSKSNPDHSALESALIGIKEIMAHVNEDKRKTEGQLQMFDIYNEIDNCPPHLVSSHRSFVSRCEVMELSKGLSGKGDNLVLFLFTDTMEVCKKRSKVFNSKSPPVNGLHHAASKFSSGKPYRHVQLMPLSTVKRVIDIRESEESHKMFALMYRSNQELKEKLYLFTITDETVDKTHFLKQLCRQMANTVCKTDAEKFLACWDFHQLDIDTSDVAMGTLSKAMKFASRTRLKLETIAAMSWFRTSETEKPNMLETLVGRAFSFNKTPSKLKRAMSSMISPFGSTSNLTPASQLAQMRLASCNNINEIGVANSSQPEILVAPLSVQPTRKAKANSMSTGGLRRS